jgi:tetratricopeptide (TPR) repeat protein
MKIKLFILLFSSLWLGLGASVAQQPPNNSIADSLIIQLKTVTEQKRVDVLNALAWEYCNTDPPKASKYIAEAIGLAFHLDYQLGLANAYRTKASMHWNINEYAIATENALLGLQLFENLKDELGIANSYLILGNIYNRQKNVPFAYDYYNKALEIFTKLGDKKRQAACLNNLAEILTSKGDFKEATQYISKALIINQEGNSRQNKNSTAHNLNNLGYLYYKQGFYDSALTTLQKGEKAIAEAKDASLQITELEGYLTYSLVLLERKEHEKALFYAQKSLDISQKIGNREGIRNAYKQFASIYSMQNNIPQAYAFQKRYIALNDSIFSEESAVRIAEAQIQYEIASKEKKISLLEIEKEKQFAEIKQQRLMEALLVLASILIGITAFTFYQNQRNQKKINQLLADKNKEIEGQKIELERIK